MIQRSKKHLVLFLPHRADPAEGVRVCADLLPLEMLQIATYPLLTSAPTVHPVINAAHQALAKLRATVEGEHPTFEKAA